MGRSIKNMKNNLKTLIVPVTKFTSAPGVINPLSKYRIEVIDLLWNDLQILLLKGAREEGITLEFDIKPNHENNHD